MGITTWSPAAINALLPDLQLTCDFAPEPFEGRQERIEKAFVECLNAIPDGDWVCCELERPQACESGWISGRGFTGRWVVAFAMFPRDGGDPRLVGQVDLAIRFAGSSDAFWRDRMIA